MGNPKMVNDNSGLIAIKPIYEARATCVTCGHIDTLAGELLFQGIHVLAKSTCRKCHGSFFHTLPVGHDLLFPASFDEMGNQLIADRQARRWLIDPLLTSLFEGNTIDVAIEKEVNETTDDAIILNCLDSCFGHAFCKLWNIAVLKERFPGIDLIILVPKSLRWLVPGGVSQVWSFDTPLPSLAYGIANLDETVKQAIRDYKRVWLSKAYTHLAIEKANLEKLLRTQRFDLSQFSILTPLVTFILREDRFWQRSRFEFFLYKVFVKLGFPKTIFIWRQNHLVNKVARQIHKKLEVVTFAAAGIGKGGRLTSLIADHRKVGLSPADEADWCHRYARSHLIIGVHGSNMLIPTALAAGFIEILPRYKVRHIAEDIAFNHSARYSHFLGRCVDQFASTRLVSTHAISLLKDFPYVYNNAEQGT
ncbi:MAG TPA: hypothetical protein VIH22_16620 [Cyclobacteriaceae bacterium]